MNLLLDTHALIWFLNGDESISSKAIESIENVKLKKFVSIASVWEVSIKLGLGKLSFEGGTKFLVDLIEQNDFYILHLTTDHTIVYEKLPFVHRDPFDRILIAQAISDKLVIITKDQNIPLYKVKTVW